MQSTSYNVWKREKVSVEFSSFTKGLLLPEVKVLRRGREVSFGMQATVTNSHYTPDEFFMSKLGRHAGEPLWRELREYINESVFLPWMSLNQHNAYFYRDDSGHPHVRCMSYDYSLAVGLVAFLRISQEQRLFGRNHAALAAHVLACDTDALMTGFVSGAFVEKCCSLLRQYQLPSGYERKVATRLAHASSTARKLRLEFGLTAIVVNQDEVSCRPSVGKPANGFSIASTAAAGELARLRREMALVER